MPRKCPPQTLCIDKTFLALVALGLLCFAFGVQLYQHSGYVPVLKKRSCKNKYRTTAVSEAAESVEEAESEDISLRVVPTRNTDVFFDTYVPPRTPGTWTERHGQGHNHGRVPINISTSHERVSFQQVGMLRRKDDNDSLRERETILALFGRPLHRSRSKWQYYTMTDKNQGIKLPMTFKGKKCDNPYGCDEIFSGDVVHVDGFNDDFLVTIYDTQVLEYI
jgi:hypothetical protein